MFRHLVFSFLPLACSVHYEFADGERADVFAFKQEYARRPRMVPDCQRNIQPICALRGAAQAGGFGEPVGRAYAFSPTLFVEVLPLPASADNKRLVRRTPRQPVYFSRPEAPSRRSTFTNRGK
jgi:hypothetical protein